MYGNAESFVKILVPLQEDLVRREKLNHTVGGVNMYKENLGEDLTEEMRGIWLYFLFSGKLPKCVKLGEMLPVL